MIKLKLHSVFLILISIILFSCDEKEYGNSAYVSPIPVYTEYGANTLSFNTRGKFVRAWNYLEKTNGVYAQMIDRSSSGGLKSILIRGEFVTVDKYEAIELSIADLRDTGYYFSFESNFPGYYTGFAYFKGKSKTNTIRYATTPIHIGHVHISKLDTLNQIISGSFDFLGFIYPFGHEDDTLSVTNGLFDLRYYK